MDVTGNSSIGDDEKHIQPGTNEAQGRFLKLKYCLKPLILVDKIRRILLWELNGTNANT